MVAQRLHEAQRSRALRPDHGLGRVEREASAKDGALRERRPLRLREQIVGALERAPHGSRSGHDTALDGIVGAREARQEALEPQDLDAGRRELDGERVAFERARDALRPVGDGRIERSGRRVPRALEEERRGRRQRARRSRRRQRPEVDRGRAGRTSPAPRRRNHLEARRRATERLDERPDQGREVLDAVENEEDPPQLSEGARQGHLGCRARLERDVRGGRQDAHDIPGVARLAELRVDEGVPRRVARAGGQTDGLDRQARLADARGAPDGHERRP